MWAIATLTIIVTMQLLHVLSNIQWISAALILFSIPIATTFALEITIVALTYINNCLDNSNIKRLDNTDYVSAASVVVPLLIQNPKDVEILKNLIAECSLGKFAISNPIWIAVDYKDTHCQYHPDDVNLEKLILNSVDIFNEDRLLKGFSPIGVIVRDRLWNSYEQLWMGYERKRGKIEDSLRFISGKPNEFNVIKLTKNKTKEFVFVMDIDSRITQKDLSALEFAFISTRSAANFNKPALMAPTIKKLSRNIEPLERWITEPEILEKTVGMPPDSFRQDLLKLDIYHGKAIIHVNDFLEKCIDFHENTILSHDHIEALYGSGQSTSLAIAYEPFPSSRIDWERRQHRWVRGDVQLLPYLVGLRNPSGKIPNTSQRFGIIHIIFSAIFPIFQYSFVVIGLISSYHEAVFAFFTICLTDQSGLLFSLAAVFRRNRSNAVKSRSRSKLLYAFANSSLVTIGKLVYIQRNAIIAIDATIVSIYRMLRGRRGLLEWYPRNKQNVINRRNLEELMISAAAFFAWCISFCSFWPFVFATMWIVVPASINFLSTKRRNLRAIVDNQAIAIAMSEM